MDLVWILKRKGERKRKGDYHKGERERGGGGLLDFVTDRVNKCIDRDPFQTNNVSHKITGETRDYFLVFVTLSQRRVVRG